MSKPFHGIRALTKYRVLVKPQKDDGTITTASGFTLIKPDETTDRDQMAVDEGELIDMSPLAFKLDGWPDDAPTPQIGDWVVFSRYAGRIVRGTDGEEYRMMHDEDVMCAIDRKASQVVKVA